MIRHTDGNLHALNEHEHERERSRAALEFDAFAKQVEDALVGQTYYEITDGVIVERVVESVTLDDDHHHGAVTVTLDETVTCHVNNATLDILCFKDDDRYYVTREEAEEAVREAA